MTYTTAVPPAGMSYVNAWRALWENIQPAPIFQAYPTQLVKEEDSVSTSEKVAELFKKQYPQFYMSLEGGRKMHVYFRDYPNLDVSHYDFNYGKGAAQRALDEYNQIPSEVRFDKNDNFRDL